MTKFNWYGWMNPWSGYGKANLEWSTALERVSGGGVTIGWERRIEEQDPEVWRDLTEEQRSLCLKPFELQKIGIIKSTPDLFFHNLSKYKIGFTMVENTKIGKGWVELCNKMDHIFVPNKDLVEVFTVCGVKAPITRVRQGFSVGSYPYYERRKDRSVFTFALAGWLDSRKNWDDVVRAFTSEFSPKEPVRLILKNTCPGFGYLTPTDPRIKVIDRVFTPNEMTNFYKVIDCFIFTSRAEGSGLPAREAMATGLPVILTDWSGLSEVCDSNVNYPIKPIAIDYPDTRPEQPGFMARLDIAEIMYWMRYVYEHQEEARQKGNKASQWMHKEWGWDTVAKEMLEIIKKL